MTFTIIFHCNNGTGFESKSYKTFKGADRAALRRMDKDSNIDGALLVIWEHYSTGKVAKGYRLYRYTESGARYYENFYG